MCSIRRKTTFLAALILGLAAFGCATTGTDNAPTAPQKVDRLAELHTQLGLGYLREGRYQVAWKRLNKALAIEPNYGAAHHAMALLSERLDKPKDAETHYRRAIAINPSDSALRNNYGRFLCTQGRLQDAESEFVKAAANPLYDSSEIAYTNAGLCLSAGGDSDKAEDYLRRALALNATYRSALLQLADLSMDTDRALQARAFLQRFHAAGPVTADSLALSVRVETALGDRDAAVASFKELDRLFPDRARELRAELPLVDAG